jgi:hypothetical protein
VRPSGNVLDHGDELVDGVSLPASELDQLAHFLYDGAAFGCPGDRDSATAPKLWWCARGGAGRRAQAASPEEYREKERLKAERRRERQTGGGL